MSEQIKITNITKQNYDLFSPLWFDYTPPKGSILLGAVCGETACGVAIVSILESDAVISYFYVAESYRRKKVGTQLMDFLLNELSKKTSAISIDYSSDYEFMHEFLGSLGFIRSFVADAYELPFTIPEALSKDFDQQLIFHSVMSEQPKTNLAKINDYLVKKDCTINVFELKNYNPDYSFFLSSKENTLEGFVITNIVDNKLYIDYVAGKNVQKVNLLLSMVISKIQTDKVPIASVVFLAINDFAPKLSKVLFPDTPLTKSFSTYYGIFEF